MEATPNFPVPQGTQLTVNCVEGYGLVGDNTVSCVSGKQFMFQTKPLCGRCIVIYYFKCLKVIHTTFLIIRLDHLILCCVLRFCFASGKSLKICYLHFKQ